MKDKNTKIRKVKYPGELDLAGFKLPCYVLEDGTRVLSLMGMQLALKMVDEDDKQKSGTRLGQHLGKKTFKPLISTNKNLGWFKPIICYRGEQKINGFEATVLVDVANIFLEARKRGILSTDREKLIADQCEIIVRAVAKVGIIALVDEATGYQKVKQETLQELLRKYISEEILEWQKTFHRGFYEQIFRLWNWDFDPENMNKKPQFIGILTIKLIYENLPEGVLEKIREKTPKTKRGSLKI